VQDIELPMPEENTARLQAVLTDLSARRSRLLEAYESGAITLTEYTNRVSSLETQLLEINHRLSDTEDAAARRAERLTALGGLAGIIQQVPSYLLTAPAQDVNTSLCHILARITLTPDSVTLTFLS